MDRESVVRWLLEEDNPPVRLLTLTRLLGRPEDDVEVRDARARLMDYTVTRGILAHMDEAWRMGPRSSWNARSRHWSIIYLGHFLADGRDPRIAPRLQELLSHSWLGGMLPCRSVSMLHAFRRLGHGDHPVVVEDMETLARRLLDDEGIACPCMGTSLLPRCYMILPKLLQCFAEVPPERRSPAIQGAIDWIAQELIAHQVYVYLPGNRKAWDTVRPRSRKRADYPQGETPESWREKAKAQFLAERGMGDLEPKEIWTRFGFPLNYNSDILEAMIALATAGAPMSQGLELPLQIIRDKRTAEGVWRMDKSLNGQMWVDVEVKGRSSKWITLFALIVLDHFG